MRVGAKTISYERIDLIKDEVKWADQLLVKLGRARRSEFGAVVRYPSGPNKPIYQSSRPESLMGFLIAQQLDGRLPRGLRAADLGSGIGAACFVLAEVFDQVVGYEIDRILVYCSRVLRWKLGIKRKNLKFYRRDFLKQDLSSFDLVHVFRPYIDNFEEGMAEVLSQLKPGARVIFAAYPPGNILPSSHYSLEDHVGPYYMYRKVGLAA